MAMSDCSTCWETPCGCGFGYRDLTLERRLRIAASALGIRVGTLKAALKLGGDSIAPAEHPCVRDPKWFSMDRK